MSSDRQKLYWKTGKLLYDGQWKYGKQNGKGKGYWLNGQLIYNGEWKNELIIVIS